MAFGAQETWAEVPTGAARGFPGPSVGSAMALRDDVRGDRDSDKPHRLLCVIPRTLTWRQPFTGVCRGGGLNEVINITYSAGNHNYYNLKVIMYIIIANLYLLYARHNCECFTCVHSSSKGCCDN